MRSSAPSPCAFIRSCARSSRYLRKRAQSMRSCQSTPTIPKFAISTSDPEERPSNGDGPVQSRQLAGAYLNPRRRTLFRATRPIAGAFPAIEESPGVRSDPRRSAPLVETLWRRPEPGDALTVYLKGCRSEDRMSRKHIGSSLTSFLDAMGIPEQTELLAIKKTLALQLREAMKRKSFSQTELAREIRTSRTVINRMLDPTDTGVTLATLTRASRALGLRVDIRLTTRRRSAA